MRTTLRFSVLKPALLIGVALVVVVFSCQEKSSSHACDTTTVFQTVDKVTKSKNSIEKKQIDEVRSQLDGLAKCPSLKDVDYGQIEKYHKSLNILMAKVNKFQVNVDSTDANIEKKNFKAATAFLEEAKKCFPEARRIVTLTDQLEDAQKMHEEEKQRVQSNTETPSIKNPKKQERTIKDWTPTAEF